MSGGLFYEGENMLVINPEEVLIVVFASQNVPQKLFKLTLKPDMEKWVALNRQYAEVWPNITS